MSSHIAAEAQVPVSHGTASSPRSSSEAPPLDPVASTSHEAQLQAVAGVASSRTSVQSGAATPGPISSSEKSKDDAAAHDGDKPKKAKKGRAFWMIIFSLAMSMFLSALDLTALSTALPRIATDLNAENFTWIGSAYALASTAFLPVFGGIASAFGRKPVLLAAIALFAAGSAICGSAQNMSQIIAGRTIQGVGGGGILSMSEIVVADLVPLSERGAFFGLLGLVWAVSSAIGPLLGGALADNWRWLFYLNLPVAGFAFALVLFFMNLKIPTGSFLEKLKALDWIGNFLFVLSSTAVILGLTWGGDAYPWDSAAVLVPLVVGAAIMMFFFWYEKVYAKNPIVPFELLSNRTTLSGYGTTFIHGLVSIGVIYYLPAWFQGVLGHSPLRTGIDIFPIAFLIAPLAIATGISVTVTQRFVPQNWLGWTFCIAGSGALVALKSTSSESAAHGLQSLIGIGLGILYAATSFPVLAPLPPSLNAHAMAFHAFSRSFGQVFGIVVGSTTLSNQLKKRMPAEFLQSLPGGPGSAYSHITEISSIPEPLRSHVRAGLSDSVRYIWIVLIAFSAWGLVWSFFQKPMPLNATTDEAWGIVEKSSGKDTHTKPEEIV